MGNVLIIGKGDLYTSVVSSDSCRNHTFDVMPSHLYFNYLYNEEGQNRRQDILNDMEEDFADYSKVYIIPESIKEGAELTILFSEMGTKLVIVAIQSCRHFQLYRKLGAKLVYISKPGCCSYSWLTHQI